jgi:hypothetical protein
MFNMKLTPVYLLSCVLRAESYAIISTTSASEGASVIVLGMDVGPWALPLEVL